MTLIARAAIALLAALPLLAMHAPLEAPTPPWTVDLVPVTAPGSRIDDTSAAGLRGAAVDTRLDASQRAALPFPITPVDDPIGWARATGQIALVVASEVTPAVKTLSLDGKFYWRTADRREWPLRVPSPDRVPAATTWELAAAGEIIFGRGVEERIETHHRGDAASAFADVREPLRAADVGLATLEAPLSGDANVWCESCMRFVGNERYARALADAGLDVVSLAANHIGDAGPQGVLATLAALDDAGVAHTGAGADARAAGVPARLVVNGVRLAILAYDEVPPSSYWATPTQAGSNPFPRDDATYSRIRADIADARGDADVVIVAAHWGVEYEAAPRPAITTTAHAMIDAGAAIVIGDHPHWVQPVEIYRGGYIAYGVGNFVFDQMWSTETRLGTLQELWFSGDRLAGVRIRPTIIEDYYRPRLLRPDEPAYRAVIERVWTPVPD